MFLHNAWYVAATWEELGETLLPRTVLKHDLVLFRTGEGDVAALEDACVHRKVPLSMGRRIGDTIECSYHGMTYDCTGACVRIPGQSSIPPRARVRSFPAVERWGWIWVWMGDPALADDSQIIDVINYDHPDWTINRGPPMDIAANYQFVTDNLVDPTHVSYVHRKTLGNSAGEGVPLDVHADDHSVTAQRWIADAPPAPFYQKFGNFEGNVDRWQVYTLHLPSLSVIDMGSVPTGERGSAQAVQLHSYNFVTPVDESNSRYYWFQLRNFAPGDESVTRELTQAFTETFLEDKVILAAVEQGMRNSPTPKLNIHSDAANHRARRMLAEMIGAESGAASPAVSTLR